LMMPTADFVPLLADIVESLDPIQSI